MTRPPLVVLSVLAALALVAPAYADQTLPSHAPTTTRQADRTTTSGARPVPVPVAGRAVTFRRATHVVGHGTPRSCTSKAVVSAVRRGGIVTFSCGPNPVVIHLRRTARVYNTHARTVIDGGGLVTLSGSDARRILYLNACDPKNGLRIRNCQTSAYPTLVVQHLTLADGNSAGNDLYGGGGGAILAYGGQLKVVDSTFVGNRCDRVGPDVGGAAVRARYQAKTVYVVQSTFRGGRCSNGGGLSGMFASFTVLNSVFVNNRSIGHGANPQRPGTPGGGSGGAIYTDGEKYDVSVAGTVMHDNHANEGGGAIFYVSNDRTGTLGVVQSTLQNNVSERFQTMPGVFFLGNGPVDTDGSVIQ